MKHKHDLFLGIFLVNQRARKPPFPPMESGFCLSRRSAISLSYWSHFDNNNNKMYWLLLIWTANVQPGAYSTLSGFGCTKSFIIFEFRSYIRKPHFKCLRFLTVTCKLQIRFIFQTVFVSVLCVGAIRPPHI